MVFTNEQSPQGWAISGDNAGPKVKVPAIPQGLGVLVTNDWCIRSHNPTDTFHILSIHIMWVTKSQA